MGCNKHKIWELIKEARLHMLTTKFEYIKMNDTSTIDDFAIKLFGITSKSTSLGEVPNKQNHVNKFLTSLPRQLVHIVADLKQV